MIFQGVLAALDNVETVLNSNGMDLPSFDAIFMAQVSTTAVVTTQATTTTQGALPTESGMTVNDDEEEDDMMLYIIAGGVVAIVLIVALCMLYMWCNPNSTPTSFSQHVAQDPNSNKKVGEPSMFLEDIASSKTASLSPSPGAASPPQLNPNSRSEGNQANTTVALKNGDYSQAVEMYRNTRGSSAYSDYTDGTSDSESTEYNSPAPRSGRSLMNMQYNQSMDVAYVKGPNNAMEVEVTQTVVKKRRMMMNLDDAHSSPDLSGFDSQDLSSMLSAIESTEPLHDVPALTEHDSVPITAQERERLVSLS